VRRLRDEAGHTLVELLTATGLLSVVIGATLGTLSQFERTSNSTQRQNEAQQEVRRITDKLAQELRSGASPIDAQPKAVERGEPQDLVFQTVASSKPVGSANESNTRRVRYCLDPVADLLYTQEQTWVTAAPPALPATTQCPQPASAGGWSAGVAAAENVVNDARAVFTYNATDLNLVTAISTRLFVDIDPAQRPLESVLETGIFLRNQNRRPVAVARIAQINQEPARRVQMDATGSQDPEGRALEFYWYEGSISAGKAPVANGAGPIHGPLSVGSHTFTLQVVDPAGLTDTAAFTVVVS